MSNNYINKVKLFIVFLFLSSILNAGNSAYIIVNKSVSMDEVSKSDISQIFLGKKQFWDGGLRVQSAYVQDDEGGSDVFFTNYVGKSHKKFKRYWLKKIFAGYGTAPKIFANPESLL